MATIEEMYKESKKKLKEKMKSGEQYGFELRDFIALQGMREQYGKDADYSKYSNEHEKLISNKKFLDMTVTKEEERSLLSGSNILYYTYKYPKMDDRLANMPDSAFLEMEDAAKKAERINKQGKYLFRQSLQAAVELERFMEALPPEKKEGKGFEAISDAVHNMTLIGTDKFYQHTDLKGNKVGSLTNKMNRETLNSGVENIMKIANKNRNDVSFEALEMAQSFAWRQRINNRQYLETTPYTAEAMEKIAKDRARREAMLKEGEKLELDKDKQLYNRGWDFFKKGGFISEAARKYNKATLSNRGSTEYKDVGTALSELNTEVQQYAQLRYAQKEIDPERLNARAKVIQEKIEKLKKANADYFDHKVKDGQWRKGTNARADRRIEAVKGLDEMADSLSAYINEEIALTDKKLEPKRNKEVIAIKKEAQLAKEKLIKATMSLNTGFPDKEDFKYELAVITVAASLKEGDKTKATRGKFNKDIKDVIENNENFKFMINSNDSKTLITHAMEKNGQKLYNDYKVSADKLKKLNGKKEEYKQEKKKQEIKSKDDMKLSANDTIKRSKTFSKKS